MSDQNASERAQIVAWLRGMNATEWNAMMEGKTHLPWAWGVADAIERGEHLLSPQRGEPGPQGDEG